MSTSTAVRGACAQQVMAKSQLACWLLQLPSLQRLQLGGCHQMLTELNHARCAASCVLPALLKPQQHAGLPAWMYHIMALPGKPSKLPDPEQPSMRGMAMQYRCALSGSFGDMSGWCQAQVCRPA